MVRKLLLLGLASFLFSFPGVIRAEDTEIFGGAPINIPPNVLIIFDNSISMGQSITVQGTGEAWVKTTLYSGAYDNTYVYSTSNGTTWTKFRSIGSNHVVDPAEIACADAMNTLNDLGNWRGNTRNNAPYGCGVTGDSKYRNLRTGNYLNYLLISGPHSRVKIDVAKETICNLIDTTSGVRFGLMSFNPSSPTEGGIIQAPLADRNSAADKQALKDIVNSLGADTYTPLAETLAEAGLYYAGKTSWFNYESGSKINYATKYASNPAIVWRCQKNYIIIMTDGEPTYDRNHILDTQIYMNDKIIGDYDHDVPGMHSSEYYNTSGVAYSLEGSDFLDDVAKFLYDEDLMSGSSNDEAGKSFNSTDFPKQNIITYTIGFAIDQNLLTRTADAAHGQGRYFTTASDISLSDIFERIIGDIMISNSQFVAPVVPVNRMNRTFADNGVYLGIFAPDSENPGTWKGNIKKFGFSKNGDILDRDGTIATNADGSIKDGAHSAWVEVTGTEGMSIDKGGVGTVLKSQSSRNFKTYKPATDEDITITTADMNASTIDIPIQASDLGLSTADERNDLMKFVTASSIYAPGYSGSDTKARSWILGDIIHSQPAILYDLRAGQNKNVIFVGANDGFMHCFVDSDQGTSDDLTDDTVEESWTFMPWDILPNLKYLPSEGTTNLITGDTNHDYFVDGSPVLYRTNNKTYVVFGLRRGGKNISTGAELDHQYFILDVSTDTYTSPTLKASIAKNILGTELLGQSWSTPHFCKIRQTGGTTMVDVLLLTGGYDTNQDNADPGSSDTKGRALFAVNAADATLIDSFDHSNYDKMNYCMVDLKSYDDDDDGCDDVIYTPSLGGDLFVFESKKKTDGTYDGVWSHRLLFQAHNRGSTSKLRKFLYAPGVAQELWGDWVYIGSGDREHPSAMTGDETSPSTPTYNRFYAIRYTWPATWDDNSPLNDTGTGDNTLTDVTADLLQGTVASPSTMTEAEKATTRNNLATAGNGWFFDLEHPGEKIVSSPIVYNKVVYFTTYTPTSDTSSGEDLCGSGTGSGTGRVYAVDYKTGEAVFEDFDGDSTKLTKEDRYMSLGSGIPSQPALVVTEQGTFIVVGTERGVKPINTNDTRFMTRYYWLKQ